MSGTTPGQVLFRFEQFWRADCTSYCKYDKGELPLKGAKNMLKFLENIIRFQLGRKAAKKTARAVGLKWIAKPIGLFGGLKAVR